MDSTTPGVHPEEICVSKVIPESTIEDGDGSCDVSPASMTNILIVTTCSDGVVIGHINIEYQLSL